MFLRLLRADAARLIGGALGTGTARLIVPLLLIIGGLWLGLKGVNANRETLVVERDAALSSTAELRILTDRLNTALYLLQHHEKRRVERDKRNQFALETLNNEIDETLDLAMPAGVVRLLRPSTERPANALPDNP